MACAVRAARAAPPPAPGPPPAADDAALRAARRTHSVAQHDAARAAARARGPAARAAEGASTPCCRPCLPSRAWKLGVHLSSSAAPLLRLASSPLHSLAGRSATHGFHHEQQRRHEQQRSSAAGHSSSSSSGRLTGSDCLAVLLIRGTEVEGAVAAVVVALHCSLQPAACSLQPAACSLQRGPPGASRQAARAVWGAPAGRPGRGSLARQDRVVARWRPRGGPGAWRRRRMSRPLGAGGGSPAR